LAPCEERGGKCVVFSQAQKDNPIDVITPATRTIKKSQVNRDNRHLGRARKIGKLGANLMNLRRAVIDLIPITY